MTQPVQLGPRMMEMVTRITCEGGLYFLPESVHVEALARAARVPREERESFAVELLAYLRHIARATGEAGVPLVMQLALVLRLLLSSERADQALAEAAPELARRLLDSSSSPTPVRTGSLSNTTSVFGLRLSRSPTHGVNK